MGIFLESLGIDPHDPEVIAAQQDFGNYADLIAQLRARRKALGMTQAQVAEVMNTKQSAISAIELSSGNPTIKRLQSYARALGARLVLSSEPAHAVEVTENDWSSVDAPRTAAPSDDCDYLDSVARGRPVA